MAFHLQICSDQDMQYYFQTNQSYPIWVAMWMHHVVNYQLNYRPKLTVQVMHPIRKMNPIRCNRCDYRLNLIISTFLNCVLHAMAPRPIDRDEVITPTMIVPIHQMLLPTLHPVDYVRFQCDIVLHTEEWIKMIVNVLLRNNRFQLNSFKITSSLQKAWR